MDTIKQEEMKKKVYIRRTRKLLEIKFYRWNHINGINTGAVPLERYSEPLLKGMREEHHQMDLRARKLTMMHKALYSKDDIERLKESRKVGGRGFANIEERRLEDSIKKSKGRLK